MGLITQIACELDWRCFQCMKTGEKLNSIGRNIFAQRPIDIVVHCDPQGMQELHPKAAFADHFRKRSWSEIIDMVGISKSAPAGSANPPVQRCEVRNPYKDGSIVTQHSGYFGKQWKWLSLMLEDGPKNYAREHLWFEHVDALNGRCMDAAAARLLHTGIRYLPQMARKLDSERSVAGRNVASRATSNIKDRTRHEQSTIGFFVARWLQNHIPKRLGNAFRNPALSHPAPMFGFVAFFPSKLVH